jgi:hypothetical protein
MSTLCLVHRGVDSPFVGVQGKHPKNVFFLGFHVHFWVVLIFRVHSWAVFRHMVFPDGFLFSVKELGFLNNIGYWIRVLDIIGSYMYIVL